MFPQELPEAAERIRKEIKGMIPETAILADQPSENQAKILNDENGTKAYGGDSLAGKISLDWQNGHRYCTYISWYPSLLY